MGEASLEVAEPAKCDELSPQQIAEISGAREESPVYGGQALMEGVMMRSPRFVAAAVRREDGEIIIKREPLKGASALPKPLKLPFVRGVFALWDAFSVGLRYLTYSGDVLMEEAQQQESISFAPDEVTFEDVGDRGVKGTHVPTGMSFMSDRAKDRAANKQRAERILRGKVVRTREKQATPPVGEPATSEQPSSLTAPAKKGPSGTTLAMWGTMVVAVAIALVVFMWTPHAIAYWLTGSVFGLFDPTQVDDSIPSGPNTVLNIIEGFIRLAFFFAYILAISHMPDIRRVFQYHGAEHKVVHAVEQEAPLTVDGARGYTTIHPRCGTNFIAIAICVAIVLLSFLNFDHWALRFGTRLAVVPFVAAIAYEILRLAGRYRSTSAMRIVIAPGALLQRITTSEPDDEQIEVSLTAMKEVVALESRGGL